MRSDAALRILHSLSLLQVHAGLPDLTPRQIGVLLVIYLEPPPHTVRGLAARLNVTKPVITRALDTFAALGYVTRRRDEKDRRNVIISRTVDGSLYLEKLADLVNAAMEKRY